MTKTRAIPYGMEEGGMCIFYRAKVTGYRARHVSTNDVVATFGFPHHLFGIRPAAEQSRGDITFLPRAQYN